MKVLTGAEILGCLAGEPDLLIEIQGELQVVLVRSHSLSLLDAIKVVCWLDDACESGLLEPIRGRD